MVIIFYSDIISNRYRDIYKKKVYKEIIKDPYLLCIKEMGKLHIVK